MHTGNLRNGVPDLMSSCRAATCRPRASGTTRTSTSVWMTSTPFSRAADSSLRMGSTARATARHRSPACRRSRGAEVPLHIDDDGCGAGGIDTERLGPSFDGRRGEGLLVRACGGARTLRRGAILCPSALATLNRFRPRDVRVETRQIQRVNVERRAALLCLLPGHGVRASAKKHQA